MNLHFNFLICLLTLAVPRKAFAFFTAESKDLEIVLSDRVCTSCVKQILEKLLLQFPTKEKVEDAVEFRINLSKTELELIEEFVKNSNSWTEADDVLNLLASSTERLVPDYVVEANKLGTSMSPSTIIILCTGSVAVCVLWMMLSRQSTALISVQLIVLLFSVGLAWNWWKLFNEEFSRRVHLLPNECKPDKASWYHSVKWFIVDPKCDEYFKAPVDDPLSMVAPRDVFKETISMLFITPFALAGSSLTTIVISLTENLMWPLNWIMQVLLSVMVLAGVIVVFITLLSGLLGLDLRFSMGLLSGELRHSSFPPLAVRSPSRTKMIK